MMIQKYFDKKLIEKLFWEAGSLNLSKIISQLGNLENILSD